VPVPPRDWTRKHRSEIQPVEASRWSAKWHVGRKDLAVEADNSIVAR
jgi:hypothetical protein